MIMVMAPGAGAAALERALREAADGRRVQGDHVGMFVERIWVLMLNDMRSAKFESLSPAARAPTREELEALVAEETVELYQDGRWRKTFRRGGPLEWFNRPASVGEHYVDFCQVIFEQMEAVRALRDVASIRNERVAVASEVMGQ